MHINKNLLAFLKCQTPKKLINFFNVEYERLFNNIHLLSYPYILTIDITNICNLSCPFCPTGIRQNGRKKGFMKYSMFKNIIDTLKNYIYIANLYNWGEPLLHNDIFKMIKYADDNNIFTALSSNFNIKINDEIAESIINSGLKYLHLSIDGASMHTYPIYRVGGDFNKVINNIKLLIKIRNRLKSSYPLIEWRFMVFKHNEHEIKLAKKLAHDLGISRINIEGGIVENIANWKGRYNSQWLPTDKKYQLIYPDKKTKCHYLWRNLTINWDGSISPCCWSYNDTHDFGIFNNDFREVWNNDNFLLARSLLLGKKSVKATDILCHNCVKDQEDKI